MSEFKLCKNGHYYQSHLEECPYCPSGAQHSGNADKTRIDQGGGDNDKTKIDQGASTTKTQIFTTGGGGGNLNKTQIFTGDTSATTSFNNPSRQAGRKLVGWLVSFTMDANGLDFRLYEGRNSVGADPGCDIVIPGDPAVSSKHLTILNRMGTFKFKDELSTNGTFINDQFEEEGSLNDGDVIRVGNTVFKFRSVS